MTHHAYLYEGPLAHVPALAADAKKRFGFEADNDPDTQIREWEKFGIDESRQLTSLAGLKSASGRALFVVGVSSITTEAQQALLKLFEEPQEGTTFVLLAPHGTLLQTLQSRFLQYPATVESGEESLGGKKFLALPYKERSEWIGKFLKDEDGARERTRNFMNELEAILYAQFQKKPSMPLREGLEDIAHFRQYLSDRSPSLKMILEHLALSLPQA